MTQKESIKHIHFIGICGVAMSALAIAFHKRGYTVTGSDKGFYPPVSTNLETAGISFYPGWHVDKMTKDGNPDLVIVGNVAGSKNPEWVYVQEQGLQYKSYPEVIRDFFIAEHSIVCAGTYGKTTSTTILSHVLTEAGLDPNYMFGGISHESLPPAHLSETTAYSIVEGDEYKASRWDNRAKFVYYSPTHLMLTAVVWDHADIYPTEANYIAAFQELILSLPPKGILVMSDKVTHIKQFPKEVTTLRYGRSESADYRYDDLVMTKAGMTFHIFHDNEKYAVKSSMLGGYSADNLTGCFAMAHNLGIAPEVILSAFETFPGIKRRLERRHIGSIDVYDDIAHSPSKAEATLNSLKKLYTGKLIAIYEPNTGNRKSASFPGYAHAFRAADTVIIPRLSRVKTAADDTDPPVDGETLTEVIQKTHPQVLHMPIDKDLITYLTTETHQGDCIVFLGSHGFRNMIEEVTKALA